MAADNAQLALDLYPQEPEPEGLWIQNPREHGRLVHGGGMGTVSIAQKLPGDHWRESTHPVEVAIELLNHYRGREDVYLSTQRFRGRRRVAHLLSLASLYADLDYYRVPELADSHPKKVLELALAALERAGLPPPSLAVGSGRGLYLLWLHSPIPRAALPRWAACQREIWKALASLGADRAALDAARVLRVIGTRHGGAGTTVESLTPAEEPQDFEELAGKILPHGRAELHDLRVRRAMRKSQKRLWTPPRGFTPATLWEARLSDLQRLTELRWFGEPMEDFRDRWLFVAGVGMSWLAVPAVLQRELYALARQVGGWTEGKTRSKMQAVFSRAHAAARGETAEWQGLQLDPRYRMKNSTILEWLEITPEEEREMKTLVSDDERRRRDRARKQPQMSRKEYLTRAAKRRAQARRMAAEGMSLRQIAKELGISKSQVQRVLNVPEN